MTRYTTIPIVSAPSWDALDSPIIEGDCLEVMRALPDCSVDAICTDPPYGIGFMGHEWDQPGDFGPLRAGGGGRRGHRSNFGRHEGVEPGDPANAAAVDAGRYDLSASANQRFQAWCEAWGREALRVLKPGGHAVVFGGPRTFHRLTCGLEDAGFEIRDTLAWISGSGFPKASTPYRTVAPCRSIESVPHAVRLSEWLPLESSVVRAPTALALVETQPEGELAAAIRTGGADESCDLTVMSLSDFLTADMSWSIASSWRESSGAPWIRESTSIIETATRAITDPRTWRFSRWPTIPASTIPEESRPDGCECHAATVVTRSTDGSWNTGDTLRFIATERATSPLAALIGRATALKPGYEPIVLARKPLAGTVAANVLEHGTGALNIDGCRIANTAADRAASDAAMSGERMWRRAGQRGAATFGFGRQDGARMRADGRWPANVVFDEEAAALLDEQTGELKSGFMAAGTQREGLGYRGRLGTQVRHDTIGDSGGASRFFYCAKTSRWERNAGLDAFEDQPHGNREQWRMQGGRPHTPEGYEYRTSTRNGHPTVKPIALMAWLLRLVTPPDGVVLDPFAGSGSTVCAGATEGIAVIGIEREPEYVAIARARAAWWAEHPRALVERPRKPRAAVAEPDRMPSLLDALDGEAA